jgi:outer membrane murein-binding lipoprotein Lpp
VRSLGGAYELPELASEADNAENLEVMLEVLVKASIIEFNDLKAEAYEDDGLQCARLRARRLALEMSPAARPAPSTPVDPLIDVKQQAITRELLAAAGKTSETSAEKAAGEKRLLDVARDAELSARVLALHALETAGKLTLADFKKAASAVQVAELLKQSKIGLPTGASAALRTLWEAYSAVQRGINREVARELEKLMPEGADCEALANATLDGTLHVLDLQKIVSSKATKTVLGSTSPKTKGAAAKATTTDAASESYAHCITGLEFALEVFNPNDQSVIATMRQVRSEVESLHRSGFNRGDAANKLLSALLTEYDHDHEEYRRGRSPPLLSTAWETALKTNKISKLISSSGGENIKVTALEALVTEQAAKLKAAADEAHKATTKVDKMATRLTELEQLCAKRWKETKSNFVSDESGSESSRPATPNGGRGKGKISFVHPAKGAGAPAPASAPAAQ